MTHFDVYVQQVINGVSLGAMYALLALGFTLVYGILELINFAHFNVFMVGSFVGLATLELLGITTNDAALTGLPLVGVLLVAFAVTMGASGVLGVVIERVSLRPLRNVKGPAAMITTIGVSYILLNVVLLTLGADAKNFPSPLPPISFAIGGAVLRLREILIWIVSLGLMGALTYFVQYTKLGKAMRATAQDPDAARMMGVEVDRVIIDRVLPGLGAGRRRRPDVRPLLQLHQLRDRLHRRAARVHRGGARRHRQRAGRDAGRHPDRADRGVRRHWISAAWADVIIFSILVLVLVFKPAGLLGRLVPNKS